MKMKHAELIARLEAAEVGSREVDVEIWLELTPGATRQQSVVKSNKGLWPDYTIDETRQNGVLITVPNVTTSLDAALALAERVLPDVQFNMATGVKGGLPWVQCYPFPQEEDNYLDAEAAATLPLALCIAILRALDANN